MLKIEDKKAAFKAFKNTPQIVEIMDSLDRDVYIVTRWYIEEAIYYMESLLNTTIVHPEEVNTHNAKITNLLEMKRIEGLVELELELDTNEGGIIKVYADTN